MCIHRVWESLGFRVEGFGEVRGLGIQGVFFGKFGGLEGVLDRGVEQGRGAEGATWPGTCLPE